MGLFLLPLVNKVPAGGQAPNSRLLLFKISVTSSENSKTPIGLLDCSALPIKVSRGGTAYLSVKNPKGGFLEKRLLLQAGVT